MWQAQLGVVRATPIGGGDINEAYRAELRDGSVVFVKTHDRPPPGMFTAEADGLAWLAGGALRVPAVVGVGPTFLALEWLELAGRPDPERFGRGLAELHARGAPQLGYARDNFLATLPQDNTACPDIATLWIEHRVRPLARRAKLGLDRELDALRDRPDRFGPPEPPARLHGDLWWGNVGAVDGAPAVFDPAIYGGHREIDLAMLALFGGLPAPLVAAYEESAPLADGWRERIALWQLYPLAAHAALFGGGYGAQVARTLRTLI